MNLKSMNDQELLSQIKCFVQAERDVLVKILHHLREIDRRRLYSALGYKNLFHYAVEELKYSEGQASRRIQAMSLIQELPEVEAKIASGTLSLSNIQKAQIFFREAVQAEPRKVVSKDEKRGVLQMLENKSVREAEKALVKLNPDTALPKERERIITETTTEVRFLMSDQLKQQLEQVRALMGIKGATMTYAELFEEMSRICSQALMERNFGKKRAASEVSESKGIEHSCEASHALPQKSELKNTPLVAKNAIPANGESRNTTFVKASRYISKNIRHIVWIRDKGCCVKCGSRRQLQFDHVHPLSLGGPSTVSNLRLLCFHCNQRACIEVYGLNKVGVYREARSS